MRCLAVCTVDTVVDAASRSEGTCRRRARWYRRRLGRRLIDETQRAAASSPAAQFVRHRDMVATSDAASGCQTRVWITSRSAPLAIRRKHTATLHTDEAKRMGRDDADDVYLPGTLRGSLESRCLGAVAAAALALTLPSAAVAAEMLGGSEIDVAVTRPTPGTTSDVLLDYGKVFAPERAAEVSRSLERLEAETGWRLRVVTAYGPSGAPSVNELYKYFAADRRTIIMTADEFKGNVLEFYYDTQSTKEVVPKNVFQELRGRYGNKYFIDEEGLDEAVFKATEALRGCLAQGGCTFVPGLSQQQREFSLIAVISGGFLFGAVTRSGLSIWTGVFCSIWVPWVFLFGFYPLYIRQPEDLTPLFQNALIFAVCLGVTSLSPVFGEVELPTMMGGDEGQAGGDGGGGSETGSGDSQPR